MEMHFPERIQRLIENDLYRTDSVGMSDSSVLMFRGKVLKIQAHCEESENEYRMLTWLAGKAAVPAVLAYEIQDGTDYLLMSRLDGTMACDESYMEDPGRQTELLAEGLRQLWQVDISECPSDQSLKNKLAAAERNVEMGLVDMDNVEPDTFGEKGFRDPEALLRWLRDNQPEEELTLSHGDYCLPNIFFYEKKTLEKDMQPQGGRRPQGAAYNRKEAVGYIDLGRSGIADKWCDIAICYRSLGHNYSGKYSSRAKVYPDYEELLLFRKLGLEPDWDKIRYYILLDELF